MSVLSSFFFTVNVDLGGAHIHNPQMGAQWAVKEYECFCALAACICLRGDEPRSNYCYLQSQRLTLSFDFISSPHPPFRFTFSSFSLITHISVPFYPQLNSTSPLHLTTSFRTFSLGIKHFSKHLTSASPSRLYSMLYPFSLLRQILKRK